MGSMREARWLRTRYEREDQEKVEVTGEKTYRSLRKAISLDQMAGSFRYSMLLTQVFYGCERAQNKVW